MKASKVVIGSGIGFSLLLVVAVWSGTHLATAADLPPASIEEPVTVTVVNGSLEKSYDLGVTVSRSQRVVASNFLQGVVTSVGSGRMSSGDVAFSVSAIPVHVTQGDTPFYRDLARGDTGRDVHQLQAMLAELGYSISVDGEFGAGTEIAVRNWQRDTAQPVNGVVSLGTVVAVPELPADVVLDEAIAPGLAVNGGEPALLVLESVPTFVLALSESQVSMVPADAVVDVVFQESTWHSRVAQVERTAEGVTNLILEGDDGGPPCGDECGTLPTATSLSLLATVHVLAETSGPSVPVAAIRTAEDGSTYVILSNEERVAVAVQASSGGIAIVSGLNEGQKVLLGDQSVEASTDNAGTGS